MSMLMSIIISSYKRPQLLYHGLCSLNRQKFDRDQVEILVLNDGIPDGTEEIVCLFRDTLPVKYIFTGERNLNGQEIYRSGGFAYNQGVREAKGEYITLSCAEMYHTGETIASMLEQLEPNSLVIPTGRDDLDGSYLSALSGNPEPDLPAGNLNMELPFFMAIPRHIYVEIGGFDEDFIGQSYEDNDLMERLLSSGLKFRPISETVVHLYHRRWYDFDPSPKRFEMKQYNYNIYMKKRGSIKRNENLYNWN